MCSNADSWNLKLKTFYLTIIIYKDVDVKITYI